MTGLTFFFDPLCPWSWRTSRWIREVQRQQALPVQWRFFSLALANNVEEPERAQAMLAPLRVAALAEREGGNEAVDRVYVALGTALHEQGQDMQTSGGPERVIPAALADAGMDPSLFQRALDDQSTVDVIRADYEQARERYGAFGVPWLVLDGQEIGFFGPVLNPVPQGQEALDLWQHTTWMFSRSYLYELKRERR
jgi:predicted DsbA family dithiol-disulfide isomerase